MAASLTPYAASSSIYPSTSDPRPTLLVTGASSGIGLETANHFHSKGWNVVATMRHPQASKLCSSSNRMLIIAMDVLSEESIMNAISQGIRAFGKIDALFNSAGLLVIGVLESIPTEKIKQQLDVNLMGVINTTRAIIPHFRQRKSGVIINITGTAGMVAPPCLSLYAATKFAIEGFSESLHYELAEVDVHVKVVVPYGTADTRLLPNAQTHMAFQDHAPSDYAPAVQRTFEYLQKANRPPIPTTDIASAVWAAATDGTKKLRYFVGGTKAHKMMLAIRFGSKTDEQYMERIRAFHNMTQRGEGSQPSSPENI